METHAIKLQVGVPLQITFVADENRVRHYVHLLGYAPERSLIVTTPYLNGKGLLVREGQSLIVRLLAGNTVLGFTTEVLRSCARPYPYLHVAYPREMEEIVVRKALRVNVDLIASVYNDSADPQRTRQHSAVINDISTTGAQLVAAEELGQAGEMLAVQARFVFGNGQEYQEYLTLPAIVRSIARLEQQAGDDRLGWRHGVEFHMLGQAETMVLHGFVYEQIIRNMAG
jgi:c-di-GMP-binding flagellar brake protein YcgR